jgi:uncharacterized protein YbjT (DUF2867 family)
MAVVLLIGATGSTGGALVGDLTELGMKPRCLVRNVEKASKLPHLQGVELVKGDITDSASIAAALDGVAAVSICVVSATSSATATVDNKSTTPST